MSLPSLINNKMKILNIFLTILLLNFYACKQQKATISSDTSTSNLYKANTNLTQDATINSIDWEGTYRGIITCSDCNGISTTLTLNKDSTYVLKEYHQGKPEKPKVFLGAFIFRDNGRSIELNEINQQVKIN